jgi:hypothetical protein
MKAVLSSEYLVLGFVSKMQAVLRLVKQPRACG